MTNWLSVIIATFAFIATATNAYVARSSYVLNQETQKSALFSQFQQQYNTIATRFPDKMLEPDFRPAATTPDYKKIQDYWIFCFAEWYETKKAGPESYRPLWTEYYSGLIQNAMEIPSFRYVLEDMIQHYGTKEDEMQNFYQEISNIAKKGNILLKK